MLSNANKVPANTQGDLANEFYNPLYVQKVTSFKLIGQESQGTDQASRSGLFYNYHVVVKKTAFTVTLGLGSDVVMAGQKINFKNMKLEAKLCFDSDVCNEVPYVKEKPLEYTTKVSERGDQVEVECKIQVLSSQLEDMLFRIRFAALEPVSNTLLHSSLILYSEPIKTVSKPDQINKKKTGQKRKNPTEKIYEMISEMGGDIKQLLQLVSASSDITPMPKKVLGKRKREELIIEDEKPAKKIKEEPCEDKLAGALTSFQKLGSSERITSVRNFVRSVPAQALGQLSDLIQLLQVEIQATQLPNNAMVVSEDTQSTPQPQPGTEVVFHDQGTMANGGFPFSLSEFGIENLEQLDAFYHDCLEVETK